MSLSMKERFRIRRASMDDFLDMATEEIATVSKSVEAGVHKIHVEIKINGSWIGKEYAAHRPKKNVAHMKGIVDRSIRDARQLLASKGFDVMA